MGQALYRTYRSKSLSEIVGQKPVVAALKNALKSGKISHAYLFTGPRGVGKTSIARILAHEINGIAYTSDELPLDIIEVDAASNRGIDEIRLLRERVHIAPVSAQKKVYIIDEVHMLTSQAFNALLKTLEEPPEHVVFILATTEAHKLPETIVSRTQRYSFKLATQEEVVAHLQQIADKEKIHIEPAALGLVAKHSGGSLRDALSLLDQVRHAPGNITIESVRTGLGLPSDERVHAVIQATKKGSPADLLLELHSAREEGISASQLATQCIRVIRNNLHTKSLDNIHQDIQLMRNLLNVAISEQPDTELELALLDFQLLSRPISSPTAQATSSTYKPETIQPTKATKNTKPKSEPTKVAPKSNPVTVNDPETSQLPEVKTKTNVTQGVNNLTAETWAAAMEYLRTTSNTIYGVLRMAQARFDQTEQQRLTLLFAFPFHQKRINDAKNRQIVLEALAHVGIYGYEIVCELMPKEHHASQLDTASPPSVVNESPSTEDNALLQQIRNVFGGAEVLD